MKKTTTKKMINDSTEAKRKKPKKTVASKVKHSEEDELIETFDSDDYDIDLSEYRDVYNSMRDW